MLWSRTWWSDERMEWCRLRHREKASSRRFLRRRDRPSDQNAPSSRVRRFRDDVWWNPETEWCRQGRAHIRSGKEWRLGGAAWQSWLLIWNAPSRRRRFCEAAARDGADCVRRKRQTIRQQNESKYPRYLKHSRRPEYFLRWKNKNEADFHRRDQREDVDHRKRGCPRGSILNRQWLLPAPARAFAPVAADTFSAQAVRQERGSLSEYRSWSDRRPDTIWRWFRCGSKWAFREGASEAASGWYGVPVRCGRGQWGFVSVKVSWYSPIL